MAMEGAMALATMVVPILALTTLRSPRLLPPLRLVTPRMRAL